ncbi:MAG TPA: 2-oxoacid:acceptor oxidoreductase family protein [Bacillota bacterium]|nr:2-oxoacid:acceptor oxidoreductase family protein [Bacillota bacterium]HNT03777.1 2-oxoacid:acceptor oxidoreductase family protein [Bacillota bacterium]HPA55246.1 2-oxoacid:acceptor oxidoreductase family protein [Bacillota bacterium]HPX69998.1 2-oxoacid:acceptor oxidoreductase family protein [Bacillota bacterium]HQA66557.1 2-oxoacid:acceptor oxidoreductase family protein [Bacillota bacterium]
MERYEIRLSGSGGQGLLLGGIILAEGAINDGKNSVQTQSYGPEARGGASKSEVIISSEEIDFPKVRNCDILLSLTQKAYDEYNEGLKEDGILIVDSSVNAVKSGNIKIYSIPIIDSAVKDLGKPMVTNIVALGVLVEITKVISKESLEKAVLERVPKGTEELNRKALAKGYEIANKLM